MRQLDAKLGHEADQQDVGSLFNETEKAILPTQDHVLEGQCGTSILWEKRAGHCSTWGDAARGSRCSTHGALEVQLFEQLRAQLIVDQACGQILCQGLPAVQQTLLQIWKLLADQHPGFIVTSSGATVVISRVDHLKEFRLHFCQFPTAETNGREPHHNLLHRRCDQLRVNLQQLHLYDDIFAAIFHKALLRLREELSSAPARAFGIFGFGAIFLLRINGTAREFQLRCDLRRTDGHPEGFSLFTGPQETVAASR
mmetsp:Transcript_14976/g.33041  ORF Transcript_14976/g.33041 Transcript_14976/m.33041 type:complete len:255 (+) Transcript_14976:654-1418(+)